LKRAKAQHDNRPIVLRPCERPWELPRALEAEWRKGGFDPEVAAAFSASRYMRVAAELEATIPPEGDDA
jgi:hypothetical protein